MQIIKSTIVITLIISLLSFTPILPGTAGDSYAAEPAVSDEIIRVHLSSYGSPTKISMNAVGKHTIQENKTPVTGIFSASVSGNSIVIKVGSQCWNLGKSVYIKADTPNVDNLIKINGAYSYAGDIRLLLKSGGIKIVNVVDYETYTMGVVPYEMSDGWPIEALKAQAVASRSYAYFITMSRNRQAQEHDLVNTTASQVYHGYDSSKKRCIKAVNATARKILKTSSGENVYAVYSASNGGYTELPKNAGTSITNYNYLPYKADPHDIKFALASNAYSAKLTIPKKIDPKTLVESSAQPIPMIREALKNAGISPSKIEASLSITSIKLTMPRYSDPEPHCFTGADITVSVPATDNNAAIKKTLSFKGWKDGKGILRPFLNKTLNLSNKSFFSALHLKNNTNSYLLASVRYGHSSGMSQIGAYQMAKDGKKYSSILKFYYLKGSKTKLLTTDWNINNGLTPAKNSSKNTGNNTNNKTNNKTKPATPKGKVIKGKVKITDGTLNMRKGAGKKYKVIRSLKKGATVRILGSKGSWYKIKYAKKIGFVKKVYVRKL